jgi:hypothetical protein
MPMTLAMFSCVIPTADISSTYLRLFASGTWEGRPTAFLAIFIIPDNYRVEGPKRRAPRSPAARSLALVQPALRPAPQVDVAQPVEHERSVSRFEAEGFRAKIYRTAARPLEEDVNVQGDHHRRQVNAAG